LPTEKIKQHGELPLNNKQNTAGLIISKISNKGYCYGISLFLFRAAAVSFEYFLIA
jgi:hypothetical protein